MVPINQKEIFHRKIGLKLLRHFSLGWYFFAELLPSLVCKKNAESDFAPNDGELDLL